MDTKTLAALQLRKTNKVAYITLDGNLGNQPIELAVSWFDDDPDDGGCICITHVWIGRWVNATDLVGEETVIRYESILDDDLRSMAADEAEEARIAAYCELVAA